MKWKIQNPIDTLEKSSSYFTFCCRVWFEMSLEKNTNRSKISISDT